MQVIYFVGLRLTQNNADLGMHTAIERVSREFLHGQATGAILRGFYDVYNQLGFGFLESVYQEGLYRALQRAGLRAAREVAIEVLLHGEVIGNYRADLVVDALVLVEIKTARRLLQEHEAQLLHYLRATPIEIGLLLNFGTKPAFKRLIFSNPVKVQR